ncbi:hypothetical protein CPB86DRAFT_790976 [Serendipita vermifera]|nr:hypothetical protein CPB86DRAFT_790976 [Serendipita vermifera]
MASDHSNATVPLHRSYNAGNGDHFYTTDTAERDRAVSAGWKIEGDACRIFKTKYEGSVPLYRAWNGKDHFYTTNLDEMDNACSNLGYKFETHPGYVFTVQYPYTVALLRAFGNNGDHFYTTSKEEMKNATTNLGYKDEGIACYVYPA